MNRTPMKLRAASVVKTLYGITAVLTAVHVAVLIVYYWINDEDQFDFVRLVDMDYEANLPTLFSVSLFFIAAGLFWLLASWQGQADDSGGNSAMNRFGWIGLSFIFVFLGVDEGAKIHEHVGDMVERYIDAEGFLYFPWIVPYIAIFCLLVLVYLPFFFRLSRRTRLGMATSALFFLGGAVVLDSIGGWEAYRNGTTSVLYSVLYTLEEVLEMIGLITLIRTLLNELSARNFSLVCESVPA